MPPPTMMSDKKRAKMTVLPFDVSAVEMFFLSESGNCLLTMMPIILLQEVDKSCLVTLQQYMDIQKRNICNILHWGHGLKITK